MDNRSRIPRPCLDCGQPCGASRCPTCSAVAEQRRDAARGTHTARGYDSAWARLSARARRLQPWCTDCGATDDLTTDHGPEAWDAKATGRRITLDLIAVLCRSCNA